VERGGFLGNEMTNKTLLVGHSFREKLGKGGGKRSKALGTGSLWEEGERTTRGGQVESKGSG